MGRKQEYNHLGIIYYVFHYGGIFRGNFGVLRMLPFSFSQYGKLFAALVCLLDADLKIYL